MVVIGEGSEEALEIRDKYAGGEVRLIALELLMLEVLNTLSIRSPSLSMN